ncbi:pyruvate dehydrogenase complex dihydrolipoamide acetyltransferase [Thecamonas trahens ATCC 50062]|uniref:Acetyltransferase component of pyruvate dehydrogenase complex n=1 Tax=Thecamonas trahens ATCC 50062 TaxID=461836 RepID=A0A0L0DUX9_THETB|nr:pyruvate dehydrogenase complex dihydrolipoamide acetyltransferase [Thecamonas trahens ATCC 50062]KNC56094.1 pyruvate dehydrogenase complex dihydrolipoamide acetyltransferase [Thecamonas trahens ATCC 50062]|eukprot:XP_013761136.1 pyruvate dehydrogenase complex dihydrolipoamide acetyltransferase [Thecamonas trahens ATCC 50062]
MYADLPEHYKITMPALSPTMEAGNLAEWEVAEGEEIASGDVMASIQTDKATLDLESTEDGYVARLFKEAGTENIPVGDLIAIIVEEEDDVAAFKDYDPASDAGDAKPAPKADDGAPKAADAAPKAADAAPADAKPATGKAAASNRVVASPLAKNTARESGVDLAGIRGTGPGGRVVQADVLEAVDTGSQSQVVASGAGAGAVASGAAYTDVPLDNVRRVIAQRLQESKQTIPHFYLSVDVTLDELLEVRSELNAQGKDEYKLSINDFVVKASALALQQVPEVNSSWQGDFIRQNHSSDISVAVDTGKGLITPIVDAAESRGLVSISHKVKDLAARARENKLAPQEYQGGTFTISNLGAYGVSHFTAIINPPQSCILAVGSGSKRVVPDTSSEAGFKESNVMTVTLSCDHRVVDGAVGARWLQVFKKYVENPLSMLL